MVANSKDSGSKPIDATESVDNQQRRQTVRQPVWCFAIMCDCGKHVLATIDLDTPDPHSRFYVDGYNDINTAQVGYCKVCRKGRVMSFLKAVRVINELYDRYRDALNVFIRWDSDPYTDEFALTKRQAQNLYDTFKYCEEHKLIGAPFSEETQKALREDKKHHSENYPKVGKEEFKGLRNGPIAQTPFWCPYYVIPMGLLRYCLAELH
jgi:hypothetical protein